MLIKYTGNVWLQIKQVKPLGFDAPEGGLTIIEII